MKKLQLFKTMLLLCALIVGSSMGWATDYSLQLSSSKKFSSTGLTDGSISWSTDASGGATVGNWDSSNYKGQQFGTGSTKGNVVLSTSSISGTITQIVIYSQTGKSGGATVAVSVGGTSWGSQNMKVPTDTGEDPGSLTFTGSNTGAIQITLTQSIKKAMYLNKIVITYTPSSTPSSGASFETETPSIDWPTNLTYTQTASTASGYSSTDGASITYSIGSTNSCAATIDAESGEVTPTKGGSVQVIATAEAIDGKYTQSSASYTLTVNDVRTTPTLAWSSSSVEILKDDDTYTLPTLNNPNSLTITYSATGTDGLATVNSTTGEVTVNTGTVGTATIKATFDGNMTYKSKSAQYTITVVDPTVKGSKYNPYTIAEVIAANPSSTSSAASGQGDVYVKGYIVGGYNSSSTFTQTPSEFQKSNLALADAPTDLSKVIPIQIPDNSIRTNYNVVDNSSYVGNTQVLLKGDILKYFGIPGVKNLDEMSAVAFNVTIASSGYSTIARGFGLDFANATPVGLQACVASEISASSITLTSVNEAPKNTGIILKGTNGTTYTIPVKADATSVGTNYLKAAAAATTLDDGSFYILKSGKFCLVENAENEAARTVPAGKAYLLASDVPASARELSFLFDDSTTGLNAISNDKLEMSNSLFFDLQGRKVVNPTKGLYIVNGKKVVIK